jgi:four helix bundle protein
VPRAEGRVPSEISEAMRESKLEGFGGYRKARELFDLVVEDLTPLARHPVCRGLVVQQVDAADSICANIEEGYGRGSKKEFVQFLRIARGSGREVRGRTERFAKWLPADIIAARVALANEVLAILTATIQTLQTR